MRQNLILVIVVVIAFLVGLLVAFIGFQKKVPVGIVNPDMEFKKNGVCPVVTNDWQSNGYCFSGEIDGEKGAIIIHPISTDTPRVAFQVFQVPKTATKLTIKVADVAGKVPWNQKPCPECDVGFRIRITDLTNYSDHLLDDFIVAAKDGWITKTYDISQFAGKPVILSIYGYAGGANPWNGEWAAIGSVNLA
jgi:hypothetical protein